MSWTTGAVEQSGWVDPAPVPLGNQKLRAWFTPGYGETLSNRIGTAIARAKRRVHLPLVLTAAPVLDLAQVVPRAASTLRAASTGHS